MTLCGTKSREKMNHQQYDHLLLKQKTAVTLHFEDVLLFCYSKLNIALFCRSEKTRHLKSTHQALGDLDGHFYCFLLFQRPNISVPQKNNELIKQEQWLVQHLQNLHRSPAERSMYTLVYVQSINEYRAFIDPLEMSCAFSNF